VTLIAEKIAKGPRGRRFGGDPGRSLGDHPDKGGPVVVKAGRYGPYVSHDGVNATLPRDKTPEAITLEEALPLLAARAEQIGNASGRRPPRRAKAEKPVPKTVQTDRPAKEKAAKTNASRPAEPPAPKATEAGAGKSAKLLKLPAKVAAPPAKMPEKRPAKKSARKSVKTSAALKAAAKRVKGGK